MLDEIQNCKGKETEIVNTCSECFIQTGSYCTQQHQINLANKLLQKLIDAGNKGLTECEFGDNVLFGAADILEDRGYIIWMWRRTNTNSWTKVCRLTKDGFRFLEHTKEIKVIC